jgi:hypothetical protein
VLKRWRELLKQGHYVQSLKEFIACTPVLDKSIGAVYRCFNPASAH